LVAHATSKGAVFFVFGDDADVEVEGEVA